MEAYEWFRPGDRVVCVDPDDVLVRGGHYIVWDVWDGGQMVRVQADGGERLKHSWYAFRFRRGGT